jgi:peptidoglycan-associated lipoprotein
MRFKILSLFAALALLSACASEPETTASTTGGGQSTQTQQPAPAPVAKVAQPTPGSERDFIVNVGDRVFFDFNKSDVRGDAEKVLALQAAWLTRYPSVVIAVEGHCDERGTREYNLALGERRANAVKEYLVSLGVAAGRIKTISYGKERPAVEGSNDAAWAQNRRGVSTISGGANS